MKSRTSQLTKSDQMHKPVSKNGLRRLAQSCNSIASRKTINNPNFLVTRHSIFKRLKRALLKLSHKSLIGFVSDGLSVPQPTLLKNKNHKGKYGYHPELL
jgi:hypothetical protein